MHETTGNEVIYQTSVRCEGCSHYIPSRIARAVSSRLEQSIYKEGGYVSDLFHFSFGEDDVLRAARDISLPCEGGERSQSAVFRHLARTPFNTSHLAVRLR